MHVFTAFHKSPFFDILARFCLCAPRLFQPLAAREGFGQRGAQLAVFEADGVVGYGSQSGGVDASFGEDALVGRDVDDTSRQVAAFGVVGEQLAFERHRQFVDERGIDMCRAGGVESRPGELVGHAVARDDTHVVARLDGLDGGHADSEGTRGEDVFRGLVFGREAEADGLVGEHPAPGGIHGGGEPLFVVSCHNQTRHRIEPDVGSEIFSHGWWEERGCCFFCEN